MAFKMKGPSLYSSSPLKKDKLQRVERGLKKKEDTTADGKMTLKKTRNEKITEAYPGPKREKKKPVTNTVEKPQGSKEKAPKKINIPVNPKAPKVKVPNSNASVKGKTQFEVDTRGVRNLIGKAINNRKQNIKRVKKTVSKVKDYFTKR